MKRNRVGLMVCVVAGLLVAGTAAVWAFERGPGRRRGGMQGRPGPARALKRLPEALEMDPAQREKVTQIVEAHEREMAKLRKQIKAEMDRFAGSVEQILNDEQREKFQQMRKHIEQGPQGRRGRGLRLLLREEVADRVLDRLEITGERREQVVKLLDDARQQFREVRRRQQSQRLEIARKLGRGLREILGEEKMGQLQDALQDIAREQFRHRRGGPGQRGRGLGPRRGRWGAPSDWGPPEGPPPPPPEEPGSLRW